MKFSPKKIIEKDIFITLILFAVIALIFGNTINGQFLYYDDLEGFVNNTGIKNLNQSLSSLNVIVIYKALIYKFFGLNVHAYHTFSLAMHFFNACIVYFLAKLLFKKKYAILTSVIFAVHPVNVEAVAWMSAANYLILASFSLLSVYTFVRYRKQQKIAWLYVSIAVFIFSIMLTRSPWTLTTPMIVIFLDVFLFENKVSKRNSIIYSFFIIPALAFLLFLIPGMMGGRDIALEGTRASAGSMRPNVFILKTKVLERSLNLFFFPMNLYIFPDPIFLNSWTYFKFFAVPAVLLFLLWYVFKKDKRLFAFFGAMYLSLGPILVPIDIGADSSERYFYLSTAFFSYFLIYVLKKLQDKNKKHNIFFPLISITIMIFSMRSFIRTFDWKNDESLLTATSRTSPKNYKTYVNLGVLYHEKGELDKSLKSYKTALSLNPNSFEAVHNIGSLYAETGNYEEAKKYLLAVIQTTPNNYVAFYKLGTIEAAQGNLQKAKEYLLRAIEINPNHEPSLLELVKIQGQ